MFATHIACILTNMYLVFNVFTNSRRSNSQCFDANESRSSCRNLLCANSLQNDRKDWKPTFCHQTSTRTVQLADENTASVVVTSTQTLYCVSGGSKTTNLNEQSGKLTYICYKVKQCSFFVVWCTHASRTARLSKLVTEQEPSRGLFQYKHFIVYCCKRKDRR